MPATVASIAEAEAALQRKRQGQSLAEQAEQWSASLRLFLEQAWHAATWIADPLTQGWHLDAICEHLEAVTDGEIRRLMIAIPPGMTKSTMASICWPAWEWTRRPQRRHITASYDRELATDLALKARTLIESEWYQVRWPLKLKSDENLKTRYANERGGRRVSLPVGRGTGQHGDVVVIDDAHNAEEIPSDIEREKAASWYDSTVRSRFTTPSQGAVVIIGQRLHERDLIGHLLDLEHEAWTVLCLPEEYEPKHPQVTPARVRLPSGRELAGDPRTEPGELLAPARVGPTEHAERLKMGAFKAAGQLQQRPTAREGAILKRGFWRFYPPQARDESDEHFLARLAAIAGGPFTAIWQSWDTSLKDTSQSDRVAGTVWGQRGANLYLLPESRHTRLNLSGTKAAIRQVTGWVEERWDTGRVPHRILVEKASNGPDVIRELKDELRGIVPTTPSVGAHMPAVKKTIRAEAASPALEGGNIYVPGFAAPESPEGYDVAGTPEITQELIEQAAAFPNAAHDDLVDSFTQVVNWTRARPKPKPSRFTRPTGQLPRPGSLAGV